MGRSAGGLPGRDQGAAMTDYAPHYRGSEYVWLTDPAIDLLARIGMEQRRVSIANGHRNKPGYDPDDMTAMRVQALATVCEGCGCAALNWPFDCIQSQVYNVADLPGDIQVRLIGREWYGLRVYPGDLDHWRVVGVVIPPGLERQPARLPGWVYAGDARCHQEWVINPHQGRAPMIAVPQRYLRPFA